MFDDLRFGPRWIRIRSLLFRRGVRKEVDEELDFHLDMRARESLASGVNPAEARRQAEERFGDVAEIRSELNVLGQDRVKTERRSMMLDNFKQDLRYAVRMFVRRPGFAIVVVATLALGIGANTTIFSVVQGVLLRPLAVNAPEELVFIWGTESGMRTGSSWNSYPDYVDFEAQQQSFVEVAGASFPRVTLTGSEGEPLDLPAAVITHDFLPLLGVQPAVGRSFAEEEDQPDGPPVAMLSHSLWMDRFGGDPDILNRTVIVDDVVRSIVGILPAGFRFGGVYHLWLPALPIHSTDSRGQHRMWAVARLKDGVTPDMATADMELIAARLERQYPEHNTNRTAWAQPVMERFVGGIRPTLMLLFAAVGLVLLMACANIANLQLARATVLYRELAVRAALGAGRKRILAQLLTESTLLAVAGGALGIGLAFLGVKALVAVNPGNLPRIESIRVDGTVLGFALAATTLAGILFGLIPAIFASRPDLHAALKDGGRSRTGSRASLRVRQSLVVAQVALALTVVLGAGLVVNSLSRLTRVEAGYTAQNVLVAPVTMAGSNFDRHEVKNFYDQVLQNIRAVPGVTAAAAAYQHPLAGSWETSFFIPGVVEAAQGERPEARIRPITPGYFETLGVPLLEGRYFDQHDNADGPGVAIINASFAQTFFTDRSPLGAVIERGQWWPDLPGSFEIVGVVADVKMDGLSEPTPWAMYFPHEQQPFDDMMVIVQTAGPPAALMDEVRGAIWSVNPNVPLGNVASLDQIRATSVATQRFRAVLLGAFGVLALILAAIGIYGVLAYTVALRTPEFGVRISLGARHSDVVRDVLLRGLQLTGLGLLIGIALAALASRLIAGLLFGITATDGPTFAFVTGLLIVVACVAAVIPAWRASRVDPVRALRAE